MYAKHSYVHLFDVVHFNEERHPINQWVFVKYSDMQTNLVETIINLLQRLEISNSPRYNGYPVAVASTRPMPSHSTVNRRVPNGKTSPNNYSSIANVEYDKSGNLCITHNEKKESESTNRWVISLENEQIKTSNLFAVVLLLFDVVAYDVSICYDLVISTCFLYQITFVPCIIIQWLNVVAE